MKATSVHEPIQEVLRDPLAGKSPQGDLSDLPRGRRLLYAYEADVDRLVAPGRTAKLRSMLVIWEQDGDVRYQVLTLGPPTGQPPMQYLGSPEVAHLIDIRHSLAERNLVGRREDTEWKRELGEIFREMREEIPRAVKAASTFGPRGKLQRGES